MHLTWQTGDPVVQLNFPNPLNVSVQVGDVAYFSNPNPVGQAQSWTATTTPHLSNPQGGIIMIGEIIQIIPWNGTFSAIVCQMPQDLFNQYFSLIVAGGCIQSPSSTQTDCSGECCNITPIIDYPVFNSSTSTMSWPNHNGEYYFNNPTVNIADVMIHHATPANNSIYMGHPNPCMVNPGTKDVNGVDDYVTGLENYWVRHAFLLQATCPPNVPSQYIINVNGGSYCDSQAYYNDNPNALALQVVNDWNATFGQLQGSWQSYTVNDLISHLSSFYPNDYYLGMTHQEARDATDNTSINIAATYTIVDGSLSIQTEEICTQGSFIMFSKDNKVNMSDMLGYYASVELRNNSKTEAELFNIGASFFESSK